MGRVRRTEGRTDLTKLIITFNNFKKAKEARLKRSPFPQQ